MQVPPHSMFLGPTPNGEWLLFGTFTPAHPHDLELHLRDRFGRQDRLLPALWMDNAAWMPDGNRWIITRTEGNYLSSLHGSPFRKLNPASSQSLVPFVLGVNAQSRAVSTYGNEYYKSGVPSTSPRFKVPAVNFPDFLLEEYDVEEPSRSPRKWRVKVPAFCTEGRIALSPHAERILWITERPRTGILLWLDRLQFVVPGQGFASQAVYVSNLDGSEMRELYCAPDEAKKWGNMTVTDGALKDIKWLPDGRRISFVHGDNLYIVPTE